MADHQGNDARWSREDVQRVLYNIIRKYEQANAVSYTYTANGRSEIRKTPRRFIFFGKRLPGLGGDSELLRDAIRIGVQTLKDNNWWPENDG